MKKPNLRVVLLIALIPVAALVLGLIVGGVLTFGSSSSTSGRMTHEQLLEVASKPNAAAQYDYYFSKEELAAIAPHVEPWDCVPGKSLTEAERYHCGVDSIFVTDRLNYVPKGYVYQGALMGIESHKLAAIRIIRQPGWRPSVQGA